MKKIDLISGSLIFALIFIFFLQSCSKEDEIRADQFMEVTLPKFVLKYNKYYSINYNDRSIEMVFSYQNIRSSIKNNYQNQLLENFMNEFD